MLKKIIALIKQSLKDEEYDYTAGSIKRAIVLLAIPMILELGLESVFAIVDIYFVGKLPNAENAIATVGLTEACVTILYTLAIGLSTAATAVVARRIGEKDNNGASKAAAQSLILGCLTAAIASMIGVWQAPNILKLMGASATVIQEGSAFARIMFGGSTAIILLFLINGIFRGAGNAAIAMRSLWLASGINILLCPLLIYGIGGIPGLGLAGAAIATTIGRSIGVVYQLYYLFKKNSTIQLSKSLFVWENNIINNLVQVAWPATVQFFLQSGSWIFLTYLVSKTGGTEASAGYQIAIRNVICFILPAWGISNAAATLVGQNLGAGNASRAEQSVLICMRFNMAFMAVITLLFLFFNKPIISLFTTNTTLIHYGGLALQIIGVGYIFYGIGMVLMQSLNGAGDTRTPTWLNFVCFWLLQIPMGWLMAVYFNMGAVGAFAAVPISETILAALAYWYFKKGKWKTIKV
jgi:putative MATE family efflux protein